MDVNAMMIEALKVMAFGVSGVFIVLTVFYFLVRAMLILLPGKDED